ncbi:MAG: hypothetical protein MUF64_07415 [Polyangiaceae bacterium]|nr:hypothetical protein [Polyangiaceae bacterium]
MIHRVALQALPPPDTGEYAWDPDRVCVLLTEDAPLAAALEERLSAAGWRVAALPRSALLGGDTEATLASLGSIGALIDVAPRSTGEEWLGDARGEAWLFSVFRLARLLSPQLNAAGAPRAWFVAVTRLDGKLGLAPSGQEVGLAVAGVYGLIKTLRLEWPSVFCRAIDLHPDLEPEAAAGRILDELNDPDQTLGEVGYGQDGRWTLRGIEAHHG